MFIWLPRIIFSYTLFVEDSEMKRILLIIALVGFAVLASPGTAAIKDIGAGGTVFIGEQGLDITAGTVGNDQIAWFPSTATASSAIPERVIDVSTTKLNFYVSPIDFSSRTGNWYSWNSGLTAGTATVAFRVDEPYLTLKVDDLDVNVDITNKWLYRGDEAGFRIETNLYPIGKRALVAGAGAPITIKFQTPEGAILSAVTNKAGTLNSLTDIPVGTSPYSTGRFWDSTKSAGTYTIWAECNANSMKDNYPQEGKTITSKATVLVTEFNPMLKTETLTATTRPATAVTTRTTTVQPKTTVVTRQPATTLVMETTKVQPTIQETVTSPLKPIPTPTRTYADGFTAIISVAAFCAAVALLMSRSR
jgi:hypothetical protein